ncbi:hypothetical protein Efla_000843 [Eimeria flavescens]
MAPLARQGLCALFAVGVFNAATALAASRSSRGEGLSDSPGATPSGSGSASRDHVDTSDQVRSGLRGTLDSMRSHSGSSEGAASISDVLSEPATIELAAVALSSINTFWMSLTPAARSQLLEELVQKGDGDEIVSNGHDIKEGEVEKKDDSEKEEAAAPLAAARAGRGSSSSSRHLRERKEDSALLRVLQHLNSPASSSTSTSTLKPGVSTTLAVSVGSIEIDGDSDEGPVVEFDFGDDEEQREFEDKALDKIHESLARIELDEADILLAFRAFIRRYSRFMGSYKERLIAFVESDEFSHEVKKLKGAIRHHDKKEDSEKSEEEKRPQDIINNINNIIININIINNNDNHNNNNNDDDNDARCQHHSRGRRLKHHGSSSSSAHDRSHRRPSQALSAQQQQQQRA